MVPVPVDSPTKLKPTFELDLEGLRGFAALLVSIYHAIAIHGLLDPGYSPSGLLGYQFPGHFCVLLFFVLSGYVIGLSTPRRLTPATVGDYLQKRFLRLYPIYAACLVLALLVAGAGAPSWKAILGNFLFLHVVRVSTLQQLAPSWSLQYEVVMYLLFIPVSFFQFPAWRVAGGCLVVGLLNMYVRPAAPLLSSYAFSFLFWCAGLGLAHQAPTWPKHKSTKRVLLSVLLLFLSFPYFSPDWLLTLFFVKLDGHDLIYRSSLDMAESQLAPHDLVYLPFAMLGILVFTHRRFSLQQAFLPAAFFLCGLSVIPMLTHWRSSDYQGYLLASMFYLAAVSVYVVPFPWLERIGQALLARLIKAGSISYALYLVHFPVLYAFQRLTWFSGSALSYWVRFILFILVCLYAAAFLEQLFQPWARAWLARRSPRQR